LLNHSKERLNKASLANASKRNNSKYKEVSISPKLKPIFKEILFYCKTGLYSRNRENWE